MRRTLIFFIAILSLNTVAATTMLVDPLKIINTSLTIGSKFTVNVNISDVTDLSSYVFNLSFNKTVLNVTGIKSVNPIWDCYKYQINNSLGIVWVECVLDGSLNGNAKLEAINFSVIGTGESNLDLYGTLLGDSQGIEISHDIRNGFFSNNPSGSCIKSNPNVTLSPSLQNGSAGSLFYKAVTIKNNDNNYCDSSKFNLTYSCPLNWLCSLNKESIIIDPQLNDSSMTLTVNSSDSTSLGNYSVYVTAINNSYLNTGLANITITRGIENKTLIITGANPDVADRYKNTTLWCDYRNSSSNTEILGADVKFEVEGELANYTAIFNTTTNLYEYKYNITTNRELPYVRCSASATSHESNFSTFYLGVCQRENPSLEIIPSLKSNISGSVLNYTINVTNNDPSGWCGSSVFNFSIVQISSGWTHSFNPTRLYIDWYLAHSPEISSNTSNLNITSPLSTLPGNYTINVTVTNLNNSNYKSTNSLIYNISGGSTTTTTSTSTSTTSTTSTSITSTSTTSTSTTSTTSTTIPRNTDTRLYLNETEGDFYYLNNTYANFTTWVNCSGMIYLDTNISSWAVKSGSSPFTQIIQLNSTQNNTYYNITGYFPGNATHDPTSQMHYAIVYVSTTVATTTIEPTTINQGGGGGGNKRTTTTITYNTTTTVKTNTTTTTVLTNMTISTIKSCISTGSICTSNSECCSLYCCNSLCSDKPCVKTDFVRNITIAISLISGTLIGVYHFYSKIIKAKILLFVGVTSGTLISIYYYLRFNETKSIKQKNIVTEKVSPDRTTQIEKELVYLKGITEKIKAKGYDVSQLEMKLALAENDLKQNLISSANVHLENAKNILKSFLK